MVKIRIFAGVVTALAVGLAWTGEAGNQTTVAVAPAAANAAPLANFDFNQIDTVNAFFMDPDTETFARVTSDQMEKSSFDHKVIYHGIGPRPYITSTNSTVRWTDSPWKQFGVMRDFLQTMPRRTNSMDVDVRYGLVAYDKDGKRILDLFFDRFDDGLLNGANVTVSAEFKWWMEKTFPGPELVPQNQPVRH